MKEVWKDIDGFEGFYQVSNKGEVKSLNRTLWDEWNGCFKRMKGKVLSIHFNKDGYRDVILYKNGKRTICRIHRLVATAFIKNEHNKPHVNHIDGIKSNNNVSNLEWVTASENMRHAIDTGSKVAKKGVDVHNSKINDDIVREMFKLRDAGLRQIDIAKRFSISQAVVSRVLLRKGWSHVNIN